MGVKTVYVEVNGYECIRVEDDKGFPFLLVVAPTDATQGFRVERDPDSGAWRYSIGSSPLLEAFAWYEHGDALIAGLSPNQVG